MKEKPDIHAASRVAFMRAAEPPPDEGGGSTGLVSPRAQRITKTFRIARPVDVALKRYALERSTTTHERVTESDVIEEALKQYLKL